MQRSSGNGVKTYQDLLHLDQNTKNRQIIQQRLAREANMNTGAVMMTGPSKTNSVLQLNQVPNVRTGQNHFWHHTLSHRKLTHVDYSNSNLSRRHHILYIHISGIHLIRVWLASRLLWYKICGIIRKCAEQLNYLDMIIYLLREIDFISPFMNPLRILFRSWVSLRP